MTPEQVELIRVRIMSEAYDLADRNDSEGYNSVKVMCDEVLDLIGLAVAAEREACCKIVYGLCESDNVAQRTVDTIRARGQENKS